VNTLSISNKSNILIIGNT
jgi:hypothetical protein